MFNVPNEPDGNSLAFVCLLSNSYQACQNWTYHKAEKIVEAVSKLPNILEKLSLNPLLRSFSFQFGKIYILTCLLRFDDKNWSTRGGCEKGSHCQFLKKNQPKYFRVGIRPSDSKLLLENQ